MFLQSDSEKIGLISIMKDIPQKKTMAVLRDYLAITFNHYEDHNYIINLVDTIAKKNGISKKLTASIVFSYKYEMFTKDEIIDNYNDGLNEYKSEINDDQN